MQGNLSKLANRLKERRQTFGQMCRNDVPGILAARTYAQTFLTDFREALSREALPEKGWAAVAVGGFGRGELSIVSDIDLLFLYQSRLVQPLKDSIRDLTYGLWDAGFEVGHSTASVSALKRLARDDFSVLTSYLETQLISGDVDFYNAWRESFLGSFGRKSRKNFLMDLTLYHRKRLHQYGESSYLLEPHIKEGVGGLRDLHAIRWAGAVFFKNPEPSWLVRTELLGPEEQHWLEQAQDFLWRVRLQLHQTTGKRQDQLLFPEQEVIAGRMGFIDGPQGSAVEAFMRLYYRHTARIRRTAAFFLERLEEKQNLNAQRLRRLRRKILPGPFALEGKHLHLLEPELVDKSPALLMQFFWQAAKSEAHFHHQTGQAIRQKLKAFRDADRQDPQVIKQFFEILLHPQQAFPVLKVMQETGFLDTFLPEFAGVRYRVQHDVYHLYTVDEHLLRTVRELHRMEQQPEESIMRLGVEDAFAQLENRRVLYLAGLIHDIGKSHGKNHSVVGAEMARDLAERLKLGRRETELLCYLIEHHLLLADTALKRDLTDEKPILHCAIKIADGERLRLLYLLTIADSRATGPGAWNTWKASLLRELYVKVDHVLLRGQWTGEDVQARCLEIQEEVLASLTTAREREQAAKWLDIVSFRYLLSQPSASILRHYRMEAELQQQPLVLDAEPSEEEMWQITVATADRPGLFSIITGVLWAYGLNILSADIFTRKTGIALDILRVERVPDPLHAQDLWDKVEESLVKITGAEPSALERLLAGRSRQSLYYRKNFPRKEDRVVINEEASDFYTVVEVYTWDRPGVLHAISRTLFELDISIQLAKISTPGAQVTDVFYVTDLYGNKLLDPKLHETLRGRLLKCLLEHE